VLRAKLLVYLIGSSITIILEKFDMFFRPMSFHGATEAYV
jgi:hypothetical protein